MAEGKLQRSAQFHRDAIMSGGKTGIALAGAVSLVLGGSVGALTVWLANVSWVIAALVALASFFFFYAWGAYREWDKADKADKEAESAFQGARGELADVRRERDEARRELQDAQRMAISAPAGVNSAEWDAKCDESGEFPDTKALVFGLWHRFNNPAARLAFGELRCTVTDPDRITTTATGTANYHQYIDYFFHAAPPVRPGLYISKWQGQKSNGEWVDIASGQYEVKGPSLFVEIIPPPHFENWKYIALIVALRVKVTNTTGTEIRLSSVGLTHDTEGNPTWRQVASPDERRELERELHDRRERQHYGIPLHGHAVVPPHESITGWIVDAVTRNQDGGGSPACTVSVKDDLSNQYKATVPKRDPQIHG